MPRDGHAELRQQLVSTCATWQRRLRLQDWRITVEIHGPEDMGSNLADVRWALAGKAARIRILGPEHDPSHDLEYSLVHELLHLHLAPLGIEDETPEDDAQESAIELISGSLISLSRQLPA